MCQASKSERAKKYPTFKDLDFLDLVPEGFLLDPETYTALMSTIERDCRVLESFDIMDYSLLLGIHNLDQEKRELDEREVTNQERKRSFQPNTTKLVAHSTPMESIQASSFDEDDIPDIRMKGGIPARNSEGERLLIFVGIIDILQSYRLFKKMEHTFKAVIHDGVRGKKMICQFRCVVHMWWGVRNLYAHFRTLFLSTSQPSMQTVSRSSCQPKFSKKIL